MVHELEELSFNVSARTARLIGRENVASSEGALIELVKNTYDADADFCVVYFDIPYDRIPKEIPSKEFNELRTQARLRNFKLDNFYNYSSKSNAWARKALKIQDNLSVDEIDTLKQKYFEKEERLQIFFNTFTNIYIIDGGIGMSAETIKENWMTIGTDNKALEAISERGRAKSGEKGIGRFALDRLGEHCRLTSISKNDRITWSVDWEDFNQTGKKINDVRAKLERTSPNIVEIVNELLDDEKIANIKKSLKDRVIPVNLNKSLKTGTVIKISGTRDKWDKRLLKETMRGFETLIPPAEDSSFQLFIFNNKFIESNGQIRSEICDDFDYKLEAVSKGDGNVNFCLYRNEFLISKIPAEFYKREFKNSEFIELRRFSENGLKKKKIKFSKKIAELIPGVTDAQGSVVEEIGAFNCTFYFLKRASTKTDKEKYFLKDFDGSPRADWLDNNSGIKIFRDNFRVRPYGEQESSSWDWLELGSRFAKDPAPVKRKGKWKVSPQNIYGIINLSRIDNPKLSDKSSREGLLDSDEFKLFRKIIVRILKVFEDDRSTIFSEFDAFYNEKKSNPTSEDISTNDKEKAKKLAEKVFEKYKERKNDSDNYKKSDEEIIAAALLFEKREKEGLEEELYEMIEENSLLRVFASSGVTIASFTHELENLQIKLGDRYAPIKKVISKYVKEKDFSEKDKFKNPFYRIELFESEDKKLKSWLQYTLRTVRKDKRNRKKIKLKTYFEIFKSNWDDTLVDRDVKLKIINKADEYSIKGYEIDLDCIFNNLLINSLDAFMRERVVKERTITITINSLKDGLHLKYLDTGPGLSKDITNPSDIFVASFTTKVDKHGNEIGTGMGMWLLKKTLDQYEADASLDLSKSGFSIDMRFPHKFQVKGS